MIKRERKHILILLLVSVLPLIAVSETPYDFLEKANEAYSQGEYAYAAELYEQILEEGYESAELYYNIGNAYFRDNKIAHAILNYERAKKLNPNDENIIHNLQVANARIVDRVEPVPRLFYERWWQNILTMQSERGWAITSIFLFLSLLSCLVWFFSSNKTFTKKIVLFLSLVFVIATSLSVILAQKQYNRLIEQNEAIVFSPRLTAKSAPGTSSPDIFVIHQGTKIEIKQELGEWYEIKLANGNIGWIKKDNVEVI